MKLLSGIVVNFFLLISVYLADSSIQWFLTIVLGIGNIYQLNNWILRRIKLEIKRKYGVYIFFPFKFLWISKVVYHITEIPANKKIDLYDWARKFPKTRLRLMYTIDMHSNCFYLEYSQEKSIKPLDLQVFKTRLETFLIERSMKFEFMKKFPKHEKNKVSFISNTFPEVRTVISHLRSTQVVGVDKSIVNPINFEIDLELNQKGNTIAFCISAENGKVVEYIKETIQATFSSPQFFRIKKYRRIEDPEIRKIVNPQYRPPSLLSSFPTFKESLRRSDDFILGRQRKLNQVFPFYLGLKDFYQGGIIIGAPGTGKTTLRLWIMKNLIDKGIKIMDFDLKGEAAKFRSLTQKGKIFIPKKNFYINIFTKPEGINTQDFINFLFTGFVDNFFKDEKLSSNQSHILYSAIKSTVVEEGTPYIFFQNILWHGFRLARISENYQINSSFSLLTKFQWMATNLKEIFWVDKSSFDTSIFSKNLFFDFSTLALTAPFEMIRFLLDILLLNFKIYLSKLPTIDYRREYIRHTLFVDEAQILLPKNKGKLTQIEEAITTLRYKGVAVIASGTSSNLISTVLLNSGFFAKFRGSETNVEDLFGLKKEETKLFPVLQNYSFLVKSKTTGFKTEIAETIPFEEQDLAEPNDETRDDFKQILPDFELDEILLEFIKICAIFEIKLPKPIKMSILNSLREPVQKVFVEQIFHPKQLYELTEVLRTVDLKIEPLDQYVTIYSLAICFKSTQFLESVPKKIKVEIDEHYQRIIFVNLRNFFPALQTKQLKQQVRS